MECYGTVEIVNGDTVARSEKSRVVVSILDDGLTDLSPILLSVVVSKLETNIILSPAEAVEIAKSLSVLGNGAVDDFNARGCVGQRFRA